MAKWYIKQYIHDITKQTLYKTVPLMICPNIEAGIIVWRLWHSLLKIKIWFKLFWLINNKPGYIFLLFQSCGLFCLKFMNKSRLNEPCHLIGKWNQTGPYFKPQCHCYFVITYRSYFLLHTEVFFFLLWILLSLKRDQFCVAK